MYLHETHVITNKVRQENEVRKALNKVVPQVIEQLRPFTGQKILKADESMVKKFTDKIGFLPGLRAKIKIKPLEGMEHASISCLYVVCSRYSMRLEISVSFQISDHGCTYAKKTVYIGDIKNSFLSDAGNGTLEKVCEYIPYTMLSVAGQWQKYQQAYKAHEKAEKAQSNVDHCLRDLLK